MRLQLLVCCLLFCFPAVAGKVTYFHITVMHPTCFNSRLRLALWEEDTTSRDDLIVATPWWSTTTNTEKWHLRGNDTSDEWGMPYRPYLMIYQRQGGEVKCLRYNLQDCYGEVPCEQEINVNAMFANQLWGKCKKLPTDGNWGQANKGPTPEWVELGPPCLPPQCACNQNPNVDHEERE